MTSLAACLSPPVLDSIGKAIHIADIFLCPPLTLTPACYGRVVLLMLPFTRAAVTVVLIKHFHTAIIDSTGVRKSRGVLTVFLCTFKKEGELQSKEQPPPAPIRLAHCSS